MLPHLPCLALGRRKASGRIQHYSSCIPYILPFVAIIASIIGTEDKPNYNSSAANEAAVFIRSVLEDHAFRGENYAFRGRKTMPSSVG